MKKRILVCVLAFVFVFAMATNALALSSKAYNGSCTGQFNTTETLHKINDTQYWDYCTKCETAQGYNMMFRCNYRLSDSRSTPGNYRTMKTVDYRGVGQSTKYSNSMQGYYYLNIVNAYAPGDRMYASGTFSLDA